jgi:hypothetical protein
MILQSARFPHFCHHRLHLVFDYTPMHQDDQGPAQLKIKIALKTERRSVAVVVSIARGHDASYSFKTIGAPDHATITGERGAGYYLAAVQNGGQPAGNCVGNGAAGPGCHGGDVAWREEFEPLRDIARPIWQAAPRADTRAEVVRMAARLAPRGELTHAQERAATAAGLAQAQESRAAWARADPVRGF